MRLSGGQTLRLIQLSVIVLFVTIMDVGIFKLLEVVFPGLDGNVETNIGRALFAVMCWAMMAEFLPGSLRYVALPRLSIKGWAVLFVIFFMYLVPGFIHGQLPTDSVATFFDVLLFAMLIGLAEEFIARGFVFELFHRMGFWVGVNVSAITFGLMHFYNLSGGRNLTYTIYQVIHAACFGYLALGLMIYSGSIWVPIVFHGLFNLPLVTIEDLGMGDIAYSWIDAVAAFMYGSLMVVLGLALIWARRGWPRFVQRDVDRFVEVAKSLKLVK